MRNDRETFVVVRRQWNDWRTAEVGLSDLQDVHWFQPDGALRPLIHAYVPCTRIATGNLPHDCRSTTPPHHLLVCVLKRHTAPAVYRELTRRAGHRRVFASA